LNDAKKSIHLILRIRQAEDETTQGYPILIWLTHRLLQGGVFCRPRSLFMPDNGQRQEIALPTNFA
jgi:hypothetical protein